MEMEIPKTVQQKLDEGRQYRSVVEIRALPDNQIDSDEKIVEGYACTFNQPYELFSFDGYTVREQIDPHAFDKCDMSDVIMQYDHEGRVFARTSNSTLMITPDSHGLRIRGDLGGTEIGRQLYEEIDGGYTNKMSFGFTVDTDERLITEDTETGTVDVLRTITGIRKLYDVSAVSLPANNATEISARSYCDGLIAELTEERRQREMRERQKQKIKIMLNL
jgi:hypothetical protein